MGATSGLRPETSEDSMEPDTLPLNGKSFGPRCGKKRLQ